MCFGNVCLRDKSAAGSHIIIPLCSLYFFITFTHTLVTSTSLRHSEISYSPNRICFVNISVATGTEPLKLAGFVRYPKVCGCFDNIMLPFAFMIVLKLASTTNLPAFQSVVTMSSIQFTIFFSGSATRLLSYLSLSLTVLFHSVQASLVSSSH